MNIKKPYIIIPVIFVAILFVSCSTASVPVTQKQIVEINLSDPVPCSFEIHNPTDNVMLYTVKATDQYFNPQKINYTVSENWEDRTARYTGWQRVNWLVMPDHLITVEPHTTEEVEFSITPQGTGTFWGKFEVMDDTPQSNMMAIKMCYVSQVIAHIHDMPATTSSGVNVSSDVDAEPCYIAYIIAFGMAFLVVLLFMAFRWKKNTAIRDYRNRKKQ